MTDNRKKKQCALCSWLWLCEYVREEKFCRLEQMII